MDGVKKTSTGVNTGYILAVTVADSLPATFLPGSPEELGRN